MARTLVEAVKALGRWWRQSPQARRRGVLAAVSVVLLAVGITLLVFGVHGQQRPPQPPLSAGTSAGTPAAPVTPSPRPPTAVAAPSRPPPTNSTMPPLAAAFQITIPAIGVHAAVIDLGLNADQTVQVPPLDQVKVAGWYKYSPLPGDVGPSIMLGHIDSAVAGRGVFFSLGALKPGDTISVLRPDHRTAEFVVSRVAEFAKSAFPAQEIYGNTDDAELRLITCGGRFDSAARSYLDNIVAFATLQSIHA